MAIAIIVLVQRHRNKEKSYEMILRATEAGGSPQEIEELLGTVDGGGSGGNALLKAGCIVAAIGLGVFFIGLLHDVAQMSLGGGAFVFVLGLGTVAAWFFGDRRGDGTPVDRKLSSTGAGEERPQGRQGRLLQAGGALREAGVHLDRANSERVEETAGTSPRRPF